MISNKELDIPFAVVPSRNSTRTRRRSSTTTLSGITLHPEDFEDDSSFDASVLNEEYEEYLLSHGLIAEINNADGDDQDFRRIQPRLSDASRFSVVTSSTPEAADPLQKPERKGSFIVTAAHQRGSSDEFNLDEIPSPPSRRNSLDVCEYRGSCEAPSQPTTNSSRGMLTPSVPPTTPPSSALARRRWRSRPEKSQGAAQLH